MIRRTGFRDMTEQLIVDYGIKPQSIKTIRQPCGNSVTRALIKFMKCYGKYEIKRLICILKKGTELLFRFNEIKQLICILKKSIKLLFRLNEIFIS